MKLMILKGPELTVSYLKMKTIKKRSKQDGKLKKYKYISVGTKRSKLNPLAYNMMISIDERTVALHKDIYLSKDYALEPIPNAFDNKGNQYKKIVIGIDDGKVMLIIKPFMVGSEYVKIRLGDNIEVVRHCYTNINGVNVYTPLVIMSPNDVFIMSNKTHSVSFLVKWDGVKFVKMKRTR